MLAHILLVLDLLSQQGNRLQLNTAQLQRGFGKGGIGEKRIIDIAAPVSISILTSFPFISITISYGEEAVDEPICLRMSEPSVMPGSSLG